MPRATEPAAKTTKPKTKSPRARVKKSEPEVRLTGDRLVVRIPGNGERKSASGLLIPATAMPAPKQLAWGEVALVGPDVRVAKQGDQVLFLPSAALDVELHGEDLALLRERDVQAVSSAPADGTNGKERAPGQYL
jgi:chaperonin GroES